MQSVYKQEGTLCPHDFSSYSKGLCRFYMANELLPYGSSSDDSYSGDRQVGKLSCFTTLNEMISPKYTR